MMQLAQLFVYGLAVALFVGASALFVDAFRRLFPKLSFSPGVRAAAQHTRSRNTVFAQNQRRTGARYFVGSGTDQNDIAIARDLVMPRR